jgi:hypothetical protein
MVLVGHMRDGTGAGLLADLLAQSYRRALASATGAITFGAGFVAADAPEPSFVEHHFNAMPPQRHIAFASLAHIVLLDADHPTMGTGCPLIGSNHLNTDLSIGLHLLLEHPSSCSL